MIATFCFFFSVVTVDFSIGFYIGTTTARRQNRAIGARLWASQQEVEHLRLAAGDWDDLQKLLDEHLRDPEFRSNYLAAHLAFGIEAECHAWKTRAQQAEARLAKIAERHVRCTEAGNEHFCAVCDAGWPCETSRLAALVAPTAATR